MSIASSRRSAARLVSRVSGTSTPFELLRIVDTFAERFDDLPELIPGRPHYRVLVTAGLLVRGLNVVGQILADGAVELLSIDVDLDWD